MCLFRTETYLCAVLGRQQTLLLLCRARSWQLTVQTTSANSRQPSCSALFVAKVNMFTPPPAEARSIMCQYVCLFAWISRKWRFDISPRFSPRKSEGVCFTGVGFGLFVCLSVCLSVWPCVCLSVTTITKMILDGFALKFTRRFLGGKGRPSSCCVTSVEGCGSNGQKTGDCLHFYTSNSMCGKCCQVSATKTPKFRFRGELYSLRVLSI